MRTLLIRRRRPVGEPARAEPTAWPFVTTVEGTAGAGRLSVAIGQLGVDIAELRQVVIDPDVDPSALDGVSLAPLAPTVVLGSHLVNLPSEDARRAFLRFAVRHAFPGGEILVEHHPVDWAETAEPTPPTPGSVVGMEAVRRHPPFVSAVSTYDSGGHEVRQPFTARVLSEAELEAELTDAGLVGTRRRSPTWLGATVPKRNPNAPHG